MLYQLSYARVVQSARRDSNPRHPAWEASTLPTELLAQLVSPAEVEPACSGVPDNQNRFDTSSRNRTRKGQLRRPAVFR